MFAKPSLLFMGDVKGIPFAKTGYGLRDWAPDAVVGQWRLPGCDVDLGLPELDAAGGVEHGARSLLIAAAPIGGVIEPSWVPSLLSALEAGLDIVSGLHSRLRDVPELAEAADRLGRELTDIRGHKAEYTVATGKRRTGKRLLTVGTDCALGKKYAALAIARALREAGFDADFRATGQTGIMISGSGVAIDSVIADFIAGAAETLSPDASADHWDVIEGQGALFHPAYAGVTLGLVHGSQPDAMVLCHDPLRTTINGFPDYPLPDLATAITRYEEAARVTNPDARVLGISLNTSRLDDAAAAAVIAEIEADHGLPCFDPLRTSLTPLVQRLAAI